MSARFTFLNPLTVLDDRALLNRFTEQHDQTAFEQLVKRHGRLVFGTCRRAVRDAHLAEDAFQAAFLVLARNPKGAAESASVGGWLFGVARRVGLAARRYELRREKRERKALRPEADARPPGADVSDLLAVLDEELGAIPDDLRAALVACFLEERTHDEAARELGWSVSTLRRRLERGKELLRSRLARRGVALGAGLLTSALARPAGAAVPVFRPSPTSTALANEVLKRGAGLKIFAAVTAVALAAGGLVGGLSSAPVPVPIPAPAVASAPAPLPVAEPWATLSGQIVFPGDREPPRPKLVATGQMKDADVWGPFGPLGVEDVLVHAENRGLANAVVWLRPDSDDRRAGFPAEKVHPDHAAPGPQKHTVLAAAGQFRPRVLAVRAGDQVTVENRLPVPTNVQYSSGPPDGESRDFNVLLARGVAHTSKPLPALHAPDSYRSSIYPWMTGFVWAFDHPYFAVTNAHGRFEIRSVPAGTWRLVVWHEAVGYRGGAPGRLGTKVTVPEGRSGSKELAPLVFRSDGWPGP